METRKLAKENFKKNNPEYFKEYYSKNKDRIIERMKEKVQCEVCNKSICRSSYSRHCNGKTHKRRIEDQQSLKTLIEKLNKKTEDLENQLKTHLKINE